jgi:hypothetical protein
VNQVAHAVFPGIEVIAQRIAEFDVALAAFNGDGEVCVPAAGYLSQLLQ